MFYIWVDYKDGNGYEPHTTFVNEDRDDADFEIRDLKDSGYNAKFGEKFPDTKPQSGLSDYALESMKPIESETQTEFARVIASTDDAALKRRVRAERLMVGALIRAILETGACVTVYDGEEYVIRVSRNYAAIMKVMWQTDTDLVIAHRDARNNDGSKIGGFDLVYGNDGYDVVSDYSAHEYCQKIWDDTLAPLADRLERNA